MVVVFGASSSEDDEEESDEDEVDAALLLRFLFLFLCVGRGFVTAGGILRELFGFQWTLNHWQKRNYVIRVHPKSVCKSLLLMRNFFVPIDEEIS